jgi:Ca-activated chloride channel homolog
MRLRNKNAVGLVVCLWVVTAVLSWERGQLQAQQSQPQRPATTPLPADIDPSDPALPVWLRAGAPHATTGSTPATGTATNVPSTQPAPSGTALGEVTREGDKYKIRIQSDEVTLQATVVDQKHHLVTSLAPANFEIYEDGQVQQITSFRREDIPVSIGIVVDNSGSMRTKRTAVTKAVLNLVQASNPSDEVFIVNFNYEPYLDQPFTNKIELMREALDRVDSRGETALYDAVIASADYLAKGAQREKKVLLVVTDGDDNASTESLEQAVQTVQNDKGPTIYCIGILSKEDRKRTAKRALEELSTRTGGVAFFPENLDEVDEISKEVARDIRNQYTITYKPSNPRANGGYRSVRVLAHAPGFHELQVHTRTGYYANEQRAASSSGTGH